MTNLNRIFKRVFNALKSLSFSKLVKYIFSVFWLERMKVYHSVHLPNKARVMREYLEHLVVLVKV